MNGSEKRMFLPALIVMSPVPTERRVRPALPTVVWTVNAPSESSELVSSDACPPADPTMNDVEAYTDLQVVDTAPISNWLLVCPPGRMFPATRSVPVTFVVPFTWNGPRTVLDAYERKPVLKVARPVDCKVVDTSMLPETVRSLPTVELD